jgi:mono/diheme cytochrome c family protein
MPPKPLAGAVCFRDSMPTVMGKGCLNSANLTNHETGLKNRTDQQIIDMIRTGKRPDGKYLYAPMPTHLFANLTDNDAQAIVDYLRTVPGVDNMLPANEEPWGNDTRPTAQALVPVKLDEANAIPAVGAGAPAGAANGRYLAALTCIECHTKPLPDAMPTKAFDVTLAFQGGKSFAVTGGGTVYSANLTPDDTGTKGWAPADFVKVLKMGLDREGKKVCPPMRSYATMTDGDATDIGTYLLSLPAKANMIPMQCSM